MATGGSGFARIIINAQNNTNQAFSQIQQQMSQLQSSLSNQSGWQNMAKGAFAGGVALAALGKAIEVAKQAFVDLIDSQREFDKLNNQLITATGSSEEAAKAFKVLQEFAKSTPFDLAQTTEAFVKLKNLGLEPSEKALRLYGDMASGSGEDLIQLIEAVADASTGEFERLKEFGIKTKKEGENVAFTFQGQTKVVKNSSEEIQKAIQEYAKYFEGSGERASKTLDGKLSAMSDSYKQMLLSISQNTGFADLAMSIVDTIGSMIDSITYYFESDNLQNTIMAFKKSFSDIVSTFSFVSDMAEDIFGGTFGNILPKLFVGLLTVVSGVMNGIVLIIRQVATSIVYIGNNISIVINAITSGVSAAIKALQNPLSLDSYKNAYLNVMSVIDKAQKNLQQNNTNTMKIFAGNTKIFIDKTMAFENARIKNSAAKSIKPRATGDRLAGYGIGGGKDDDKKDDKKSSKAKEAQKLQEAIDKDAIERLKIVNKQELDILKDSFENRKISAKEYYQEKDKLELASLDKEIEIAKQKVNISKGAEQVQAETALFKLEKEREGIIRSNAEAKAKYLEDLKKEIDSIDISLLEKSGKFAEAEAIKATNQFKELKQKILLDGTDEQKASLFNYEELVKAEAKFEGVSKELELKRKSLELTRQEIDNGTVSSKEFYVILQDEIKTTRDEAIKAYEAMLKSQEVLKNPELVNKIREQVIELKSMKTAGEEAFDNLNTAVKDNLNESINGLIDGTMSLSDAFKNLGKTILQSLSQDLSSNISSGIMNIFKGSSGGQSFGGGLSSIFDSVFKGSSGGGFDFGSIFSSVGSMFGFAANGGEINRPTIVGEQGPELFIPRGIGSIIPNARMNQMTTSGNQVVMNIQANDAQSFMQNQGKIQAKMYRALNAQARRNG